MIVDVSKKVLIVGLGLLGGSYARGLKRFGFHISAINLTVHPDQKVQNWMNLIIRILREVSYRLSKAIIKPIK